MCVTCGCSNPKLAPRAHVPAEREHHAPGDLHYSRTRGASRGPRSKLQLERSLLDKNQRLADQNRAWLAARSCLAFNVMGSPGAGKTALLEAVVRFAPDLAISVVEGDQATERDAERIRQAGCRAIQINTERGVT